MALTPSRMNALGGEAPALELNDAFGKPYALPRDGKAAATLVAFLCVHCPYVVHLKEHFAKMAREWAALGVRVVAVNSNDPGRYREDEPEGMREDCERYGFAFPYLVDAEQSAALAYGATCTPDFFLYDRDLKLAYRGQYDASRPGNGIAITAADIDAAVRALVEGRPVADAQFPSMGCSIKWKPGKQPDWA